MALLGCLAAGPIDAAIYRYVDANGVAHFSDAYAAVPERYRDQVTDVSETTGRGTGFQVVEGLNGGQQAAPGAVDEESDASWLDFAWPESERESGDSSAVLEAVGVDAAGGPAAAAKQLASSFGIWIVLVVLLFVALFLAIGGLILKLACRIAGAEPPSLGRACVILLAQSIVGSAVGGFVNLVGVRGVGGGGAEEASLVVSLLVAGISMLLSWFVGAAVLHAMTDIGFLRSLWVGVVHTGLVLALILVPIVGVVGLAAIGSG